jgi:hypothetical protein
MDNRTCRLSATLILSSPAGLLVHFLSPSTQLSEEPRKAVTIVADIAHQLTPQIMLPNVHLPLHRSGSSSSRSTSPTYLHCHLTLVHTMCGAPGIVCWFTRTTSRRGPHVPFQARFLAKIYLCKPAEPDSPFGITMQWFGNRPDRGLNFLVYESKGGFCIHATAGLY